MRGFAVYLFRKHLFLVLSLVLLLAYYWSASKLPAEAVVYPNLIMPITGLMWLWNFLLVVADYRSLPDHARAASPDPSTRPAGMIWAKIVLFLFLVAYAALLPVAGFVVTTTLFTAAVARFLGLRRLAPLLSFAVVSCACLYVVFVWWLNVPFPAGLIFAWAGR